MDADYPLWFGLLAAFVWGGWLINRQFEESRREHRQIIKAVDFLEREISRLRERLPLSDQDRSLLKSTTDQRRPDRVSDFK